MKKVYNLGPRITKTGHRKKRSKEMNWNCTSLSVTNIGNWSFGHVHRSLCLETNERITYR